jgi:outer membrane biosynthesis protein TonB
MSLICRQNRAPRAFSRLATVRRLVAFAAVLSLAVTSLAACGGGEDAKLLPGTTAAEITENLARVRQYAEEGECVGATDAAAEVSAQVEALRNVDAKLKEALQQGTEKLDEVVAGCEESAPEPTTSEETTKPEHREPPGQEKKAEKEREKEEKDEEKEEKDEEKEVPPGPPEEKPTPEESTPPPSEGGGTGAPGGVSPGAPAGPAGGE